MGHFLCGVGSDVVNTVTFETETKTLLKTSRPRLQNSRDRDSRLQNMPNLKKNVVITSKMNFFQISGMFWLFLTCKYNKQKIVEL